MRKLKIGGGIVRAGELVIVKMEVVTADFIFQFCFLTPRLNNIFNCNALRAVVQANSAGLLHLDACMRGGGYITVGNRR